jgi:hypothetical protein
MTCPLGRFGPEGDLVWVRVVAVGVTVALTLTLTGDNSSPDRVRTAGRLGSFLQSCR